MRLIYCGKRMSGGPLRRIIHRDGNPARRYALSQAIVAELLRPASKAEKDAWR
jgi:hypothetical protein